MDELLNIDIQRYLRLVWRHKYFIVIPTVIFFLLSLFYSFTKPDIYRSTTTILVEPQSIPREFIGTTITLGLDQYLRTLEEQLKSTNSIEKIINEFNLYEGMRKEKTREEVIDFTRSQIQVTRNRADAFTVGFTHTDPIIASKVTEKLAQLFLEENIKFREETTESTYRYLDERLKEKQAELAKMEEEIKVVKEQNIGQLPGQLDANLSALSRMQQQLQHVNEQIIASQLRLTGLKERLDSLYTPPRTEVEDETLTQIQTLKSQLIELKTKYTDKHPDVVTLENQIKTLEAKRKESPSTIRTVSGQSPEYYAVYDEYLMVKGQLAALNTERARLQREIDNFQVRVEETPRVEIVLSKLESDYQLLKEQYEHLLRQKFQAEGSVDLEKKKKGEQFRILSPPNIPEKPISPNRPLIIFVGLFFGLGCGFGFVFFSDLLFRPFTNEEELEKFAQIQVLGAVPLVGKRYTELQKMRRYLVNLFGVIFQGWPRKVSKDDKTTIPISLHSELVTDKAPSFLSPSVRNDGDGSIEGLTLKYLTAEYRKKGFMGLLSQQDEIVDELSRELPTIMEEE